MKNEIEMSYRLFFSLFCFFLLLPFSFFFSISFFLSFLFSIKGEIFGDIFFLRASISLFHSHDFSFFAFLRIINSPFSVLLSVFHSVSLSLDLCISLSISLLSIILDFASLSVPNPPALTICLFLYFATFLCI